MMVARSAVIVVPVAAVVAFARRSRRGRVRGDMFRHVVQWRVAKLDSNQHGEGQCGERNSKMCGNSLHI